MSWNQQGGSGGYGGEGFGPPPPPDGGGYPPPPGNGGYPPPPPFGPPPMPAAPPVPREPADPLRAAAVGVLNLSGLGLGYLLTRRWIAFAVALIGTGVFLAGALPADPDGVSGGLLVGYLVFLALTAAHGALRGLRTRLSFPPRAPLALLLGLVMLAVPAGAVVYYSGAKDDATQKMLLERLDKADQLVVAAKARPFDSAKSDYSSALGSYQDLHSKHPGSKAAKQVPDRMRTFYTAVGTPYDQKKFCDAIEPLKYLRTVPQHIDGKALGSLAGWPDDRLATSLYECGMTEMADPAPDSAADGGKLGELLTTFPKSAQAAKVEPAVKANIDSTAKGLGGNDPCGTTDKLRALGADAAALPGDKAGVSDALSADSRRVDGYVQTGTYKCGLSQYKSGKFDEALSTMNGFTGKYPHDKNRPLALKIAIAAEIATEEPDAGKRVPTTAGGGSIPLTITNDSPDSVEILYTGTVTGSFTLKGCSNCTRYASDSLAKSVACEGSGKHYAKRTLHLPAGTTYLMQKPVDDADSATPTTDSVQLRGGYIYTECAYVLESSSF